MSSHIQTNVEHGFEIGQPYYFSTVFWDFYMEERNQRPLPHHAGEISKRKFYSENVSNVSCPRYAGNI